MMNAVTLKDLAALANCSVNTVSLALKDSPRISESTRLRIQQIAKEHNYVSNNMARALVLGETKTIGLILRNISSHLLTTEARHIERYLERCGYTMYVMASHNDPAMEEKAINLMLSNRVDGLIINTVLSDNLPRLEALRAQGMPIVMISGFERPLAIDSVSPDLVKGAYAATRRLLELGHQNILTVLGEKSTIGDEMKVRGFRMAMEEAGFSVSSSNLCSIYPDMSENHTDSVLTLCRAIQSGVTGLFVSSDELAIPLMKALHQNGICVPENVAITSMDNIRFADSAMVPLTSVGYDLSFISRRAVEMLMEIIRSSESDSQTHQDIRVEPKLYIRESCGYSVV